MKKFQKKLIFYFVKVMTILLQRNYYYTCDIDLVGEYYGRKTLMWSFLPNCDILVYNIYFVSELNFEKIQKVFFFQIRIFILIFHK